MEQHAIPWYQSKIVVGIGVSLLCKAVVVSGLGHDIGGDQQKQLVDLIVTAAGVLGDSVAMWGRFNQSHAPVIAASAGSAAAKHDMIEAAAGVVEATSNVKSPGDIENAVIAGATFASDIVGQFDAAQKEQGA